VDNLYDILGVAQSATKEEIRKSYRQLAAKYHPDRNADPSAPEQFRNITKAYEVLGTDERRELYDRYGDIALNPNFKGFEQQEESSNGFNDFFTNFVNNSHGTQSYQGSEGYEKETKKSRAEYSGDYWQTSSNYQGFGFGEGNKDGFEPPEKGADIKAQVQITILDAVKGCSRRINVQRQTRWKRGSNAGMTQETVTVQIPNQSTGGDLIKIKGKGSPGKNGGAEGDLIITVAVQPHPYLSREGVDLFLTVPLTMLEAIEGCKIEVPTLTGSVRIQIPAGAKMGQKLRLRNRGALKKNGGNGDFYLVLQPSIPEKHTARMREIAIELENFYTSSGIRSNFKL
jgi:DnaJ-class molecular chaperone